MIALPVAPFRLARSLAALNSQPRNVCWQRDEPDADLRIHQASDGVFHWTLFFFNFGELRFVRSCDIPAEQSGYGTLETAIDAVTTYYNTREWRKAAL
jgi:hypothetical protein